MRAVLLADLLAGHSTTGTIARVAGDGAHDPGQLMILVTGGAGFIGSHVVAALAARGQRVVVCDHLGSGDKWRNIAKHEVEDLISPGQCLAWLAAKRGSVGAVIHLGAISATTEADGDRLVENNVRASLDLWEFCRDRPSPSSMPPPPRPMATARRLR
jgi:Nucleoside-diphosphate-sugar epimerases